MKNFPDLAKRYAERGNEKWTTSLMGLKLPIFVGEAEDMCGVIYEEDGENYYMCYEDDLITWTEKDNKIEVIETEGSFIIEIEK